MKANITFKRTLMSSRRLSVLSSVLFGTFFSLPLFGQLQNVVINTQDTLACRVRTAQVEKVTVAPGGTSVSLTTVAGETVDFPADEFMNLEVRQAMAPIVNYRHNVENPYVQRFVHHTVYDTLDYSYSVVEDFIDLKKRRDFPNPLVFRLRPVANGVEPMTPYPGGCSLQISRSDDFSKSPLLPMPGDSAVVYDLTPGDTVRYRIVSNATGVRLQQGVAAIEGQVRMIYLESVDNVRDIGGWPVLGGGHIRYGMLYRGSKLHTAGTTFISDDDVQRMRDLGIRAEFDLRGRTEANNAEAQYAYSRLGKDVSYDIVNAGCIAYMAIFDKPATIALEWRKMYYRFKQGVPLFYHCSRGCDRVGTLTLLIEGVLGVSENDLCLDYELSSFCGKDGLRHRNERYLHPDYDFEAVMQTIKSYPGETLRDKFEYYLVRVCGVSASEIEVFRKGMIVPDVHWRPERPKR